MKTQTVSNTEPGRLATAPRQFTPLELETRPTVDTAAYAYYMHIATQTARIHACRETGPVRPIRVPGSSKLHWPVSEIRRVLGVPPLQLGIISLGNVMLLIGVALLARLLLMAWPGTLSTIDWAGISVLVTGVIGSGTAPPAGFTGTGKPRHLRAIAALMCRPMPRENLDRAAGVSNSPANVSRAQHIRKFFTAAWIFSMNLIRLKDISLALWVTEYELTPECPSNTERTPS